jgi:hypothetical protein
MDHVFMFVNNIVFFIQVGGPRSYCINNALIANLVG